MFKKNDWKIVECAPPAHDKKAPLSFCSVWLSMNVLVLDPKTICVDADETAQMEQFDKLGFEVIPVPFHDVLSIWRRPALCDGRRLQGGDLRGLLPEANPRILMDFRISPSTKSPLPSGGED